MELAKESQWEKLLKALLEQLISGGGGGDGVDDANNNLMANLEQIINLSTNQLHRGELLGWYGISTPSISSSSSSSSSSSLQQGRSDIKFLKMEGSSGDVGSLLFSTYKMVIISLHEDVASLAKIRDEDWRSLLASMDDGDDGEELWKHVTTTYSNCNDKCHELFAAPGIIQLIFCPEASLTWEYILKRSRRAGGATNYYYYYFLAFTQTSFLETAAAAANVIMGEEGEDEQAGKSGGFQISEIKTQWRHLALDYRRELLKAKFKIDEDKEIGELVSFGTTGENMLNGNLLLHIVHAESGIHELCSQNQVWVDPIRWLELIEVPRREVRGRNHFRLDMFADPVMSGSEAKLIVREDGGGEDDESPPNKILSLSLMDGKGIWGRSSGGTNDTMVKALHTLEVIDGGERGRDKWGWERCPTFKWLCTQPRERFSDLQMVLMKHGVRSNVESQEVLLHHAPHSSDECSQQRHVILSGESGAGKSAVFHYLSKRMLVQQLTARNDQVALVFVKFPNLLRTLSPSWSSLSTLKRRDLAEAIVAASIGRVEHYTEADHSKLYDNLVLQEDKNATTDEKMQLKSLLILLDGMDQVGFEHLDKCFQIVELLQTEFSHASLVITTRPHLVLRLERLLRSFAYNLEPLADPSDFQQRVGGHHQCHHGSSHGPTFNYDGDSWSDKREACSTPAAAEFCQSPLGLKLLNELALMPAKPDDDDAGDDDAEADKKRKMDNISETDLISWFVDTKIASYFECSNSGVQASRGEVVARRRHHAVQRMCPDFSSVPGYSKIILANVADPESLAHHPDDDPLPSTSQLSISLDATKIAEWTIAQMIYELIRRACCSADSEAFDLLATFLKRYYLLEELEAVGVTELGSVLKNDDLLAKAFHFANVFRMLNDDLLGGPPSSSAGLLAAPPFSDDLIRGVLTTAAFHGHRQIFKLFQARKEYYYYVPPGGLTSAEPRWVEFLLTAEPFDNSALDSVFSKIGVVVVQSCKLVQLLEFQFGSKAATFVGAHSVHRRLFKNLHDPPTTSTTTTYPILQATQYFLSQIHSGKWVEGGLVLGDFVAKCFQLVAENLHVEISSSLPIQDFLKYCLSLNPAAARGIYRRDYVTTLQLLLQLEVQSSQFSHEKQQLFSDLYGLLDAFPQTLSEEKRELLEYAKRGLEAYNLDGEKWTPQIKTWYTRLYEMAIAKFYQPWRESHPGWWAFEEALSKDNFYRAAASRAFISSGWVSNDKNTLFRRDLATDQFVKQLVELGLLTVSEGDGSQELRSSQRARGRGRRQRQRRPTSKLQYFHPTIGSFLIAKAIASVTWPLIVDPKGFMELLINNVWLFAEEPLLEPLQDVHEGSEGPRKQKVGSFENFFVCYFLDELLDPGDRLGDIMQKGVELSGSRRREQSKVIPELERILLTCYHLKFYKLLNLFAKSAYEALLTEREIRTLLDLLLANISRPLVRLVGSLLRAAGRLGLLDSVTDEDGHGKSLAQLALDACDEKPFQKEVEEIIRIAKDQGKL